MSLSVWENEYFGKLSAGDMSYPLIFKASPGGDAIERKLYIRHDDLSGNNPESSYGVSVGPEDILGPDDSSWMQMAQDSSGSPGAYASPGAHINVGDVLGGEIKPFWVKLTTPNDAQYGLRSDLKINLIASSSNNETYIPLSQGEYTNCTYDPVEDWIVVTNRGVSAYWITGWIDKSPSIINYVEMVSTHLTSVSYRSSSDQTNATASAWFSDVKDLDQSHPYTQVKVTLVPSVDSVPGLRREVYNGTGFNTLTAVDLSGTYPWSGNPGEPYHSDNFSVKYIGHIYVPVAGYYRFRYNTDDGGRIYVDDVLKATAWYSGGDNWCDTGAIYFEEGTYHKIEWHFYEAGSGQKGYGYITTPTTSERAVVKSDFIVINDPNSLGDQKISKAIVNYVGELSKNFDTQIFDGPDVPQLIAPESGYSTPLFSPELTVYVRNSDQIEWQMDMVNTFDSDYLVTWITDATIESNNTSSAPTTDRPSGVWYWRARGLKDGMHSAWSDFWVLNILAYSSNPECIYLNENAGIDMVINPNYDSFLYLNVNTGIAVHDPIVDDRFIYLNVNVDNGIGKIIYPLKDDTRGRKDTFPEDTGAFG